jgi:hypothetical protein
VNNREKTGGAAFPTNVNGQLHHSCTENDMTLLDYFAAKYIPIANQKPINLYHWFRWAFGYSYKSSNPEFKEVAQFAYKQAAAMIEERKKYTQP